MANKQGMGVVTSDERFPQFKIGVAVASKRDPAVKLGEVKLLLSDPWMLLVKIRADFGRDLAVLAEHLVLHQA